MGINLIYTLGGIFIVATIIGMVLEHSGKAHQGRMLDIAAILVGLTIIITSLAKLLHEVTTVFNLY